MMRGQKGIFTYYHREPKGQIAVFLTILIAAVFIFMTITMNIGRVSSQRTTLSNASDSSALFLASMLGSLVRAQWRQVLAHAKFKGASIDEEPKEYKICKFSWRYFFSWLGRKLSYFIPGVGFIAGFFIDQFGGALQEVLRQRALANLQRQLEGLPQKKQMMTQIAFYALGQIVDDDSKELDVHDLDEDGDTEELIRHFEVWMTEEARKLSKPMEPVDTLVNQVKDFFDSADGFRQAWGGLQPYPELKDNPRWIELLRQTNPKYLDNGTPPPDNNKCYPEDGEQMELLADFEAEKLPCRGKEELPMKINNVNISQLDKDIVEPYTEELIYDFPFWKLGVERSFPDDAIDLGSRPCELPGMGEKGKGLFNGFDEVDFLVATLEDFRYWAYGQYGEEAVMDDAFDPGFQQAGYMVRFIPGLTGLPTQQYRSFFRQWYPQLYYIDQERDTTNSTWYTRIKDLANKVGGPVAPGGFTKSCPQCGWWKELDKILREKPFFNLAKSDVANNPLYKGLGVMHSSYCRKAYDGGKRRELRDKLKEICKRLLYWKDEKYNKDLCPKFEYTDACGNTTSVEAVASFTETCSECFHLSCIRPLIRYIENLQKAIQSQLEALNEGLRLCQKCCEQRKEECDEGCETKLSQCKASCEDEEDASDCREDCEADNDDCRQGCADAYAACTAGCRVFIPAINCRMTKLSELNMIYKYAVLMETLIESLLFLEGDLFYGYRGLIPRVEAAQESIEGFWEDASKLIVFIDNTKEAFRVIDENDCRAPEEKFQGRVPSWYQPLRDKVSWNVWWPWPGFNIRARQCDYVLTYSWATKNDVTEQDLQHHARVTVFDFPVPEIKTFKCSRFSDGALITQPEGKVAVVVERFDADKAIELGGTTNWFNWVYRQRPLNAWESGCGKADAVAGNASEALRCYGIRSYTIAQFYPEIESKYPDKKGTGKKGIKIEEAK